MIVLVLVVVLLTLAVFHHGESREKDGGERKNEWRERRNEEFLYPLGVMKRLGS